MYVHMQQTLLPSQYVAMIDVDNVRLRRNVHHDVLMC